MDRRVRWLGQRLQQGIRVIMTTTLPTIAESITNSTVTLPEEHWSLIIMGLRVLQKKKPVNKKTGKAFDMTLVLTPLMQQLGLIGDDEEIVHLPEKGGGSKNGK